MTTSLPEGIVTHTDSIARDIDQADIITVEDVRRLWRVYHTNKHVLRRNSGRRLENLFWRIWADQGRLCHALSGAAVAKLFVHISEDTDIIRTTPVPSPRTRQRHLHVSNDAAQERGQEEAEDTAQTELAGAVTTASKRRSGPRQPVPEQSPGTEQGGVDAAAAGTSRQQSEGNGGEAATGFSPTGAKSTTPPTSSRSSAGQRRKKTTFVANTSTRGRSSVLFRRKSSQSSTSTASSSVRSPQSAVAGDESRPSTVTGGNDQDEPATAEEPTSPAEEGGLTPRASPLGQPPQQLRRGGGGRGGGSGAGGAVGSDAPRHTGLFPTLSSPALHTRGDVSETQSRRPDRLAAISTRPAVSKTSATLAATSTAAMGTVGALPPVPSAASPSGARRGGRGGGGGGGKARQGAVIIDEVVPLKPAGASGSSPAGVGLARSRSALNATASTSAIIDDDDDEDGDDDDGDDGAEDDDDDGGGRTAASRSTAESSRASASNLPRTKSQLTLLLERDRQQIEALNRRKKKGRKASA